MRADAMRATASAVAPLAVLPFSIEVSPRVDRNASDGEMVALQVTVEHEQAFVDVHRAELDAWVEAARDQGTAP